MWDAELTKENGGLHNSRQELKKRKRNMRNARSWSGVSQTPLYKWNGMKNIKNVRSWSGVSQMPLCKWNVASPNSFQNKLFW